MKDKGVSVERLVPGLELALFHRDIKGGFGLLDDALPQVEAALVSGCPSPSLLLCLAQWLDLGYGNAALFEMFAAALLRIHKEKLCMLDYLKLRMAQAYQALTVEQMEKSKIGRAHV